MTDKEHHRVHFGEGADTFGKDNEIVIQAGGENKISLHLGFLQLCHRYEIKVDLPRTLCGILSDVAVREHNDDKRLPNVNCKLVNITCNETDISLTIELLAHKEKLLKEEICFEVGNESTIYQVTLIGRVLGKGKGTPLLRNGIHCIAIEDVDDESEASDWQGFE